MPESTSILAPEGVTMAGKIHKTQRIVSVLAGTLVALACGTNVWSPDIYCLNQNQELTCIQYAYSAWAPQFGDRMKLSSTESNLIVSFPGKIS